MWGSPAVPTMRQKVSARKFHMPVPVGTVRVFPNFDVSLGARGRACARAVRRWASSLSRSASARPGLLSFSAISSASFFHSARVSFSFGSAVRRVSVLVWFGLGDARALELFGDLVGVLLPQCPRLFLFRIGGEPDLRRVVLLQEPA